MSKRHIVLNLNSIDNVKLFVHINEGVDDIVIEARSGRWVINGKSIMGMFSLDLSKPIDIYLEADSNEAITSLVEKYVAGKLLA